jgi:hypothetical protein
MIYIRNLIWNLSNYSTKGCSSSWDVLKRESLAPDRDDHGFLKICDQNLTIVSISFFIGLTNKATSSVYSEILRLGEQPPNLISVPVSAAIFRIF